MSSVFTLAWGKGPQESFMIGKTVSHYKIVKKIGQGGMGVVYQAQDLKLPRMVALKFLPPHLVSDAPTRKRFVREARAVSALEHPNVSTIHDVDETSDGDMFIVMPCYEGTPLSQLVEKQPHDLDYAVDIVYQTALGLAKTHEKGIVHRDIKPANLFVTVDDVVKILDFGLAKLVGTTRVTKAGSTLGTVAFMSPEQAAGGEVDHRTDIWSLGVVFYQLLAGRPPFQADFDAALLYLITHEDPTDIATLRSDLPRDIVRVIDRSLQKKPIDRYANMNDFITALEAAMASTRSISAASERVAPDDMSVVVVPFDDISQNRDNEYFSEGLTEEIITDLSQIDALRVISRNSSSMLKGTQKDTRSIGEELSVRYVLRGSVRKAGNDLRITTQLVDALGDTNVWAEKFSGTLDSIFEIQERVSRGIVSALQLRLTHEENHRVSQHGFDDVRAYECYLRARHDIYLWNEEALDHAVAQLQKGIDLVGDNVLLFAGMAHAHWQYVNAGFRLPEHLDTAQEYVDKILAMEPGSVHGHRLQGLISIFRGQIREAVDHFKHALAIDKNDADSLFWLIAVYFLTGQPRAAAPLVDRLLKIDPLNPVSGAAPAWVHFFDGRFDEALAPIRNLHESEPDNPAYRYLYIQFLAYNGDFDRARKLISRLQADTPEHPFALMSGLLGHALDGNDEAALKVVTPEFEAMVKSDPMHSWFVATCFAVLGQENEALDWLEHAVNLGFISYPFFSEHDRMLDKIRGGERFDKLLARVKTEWEAFVA